MEPSDKVKQFQVIWGVIVSVAMLLFLSVIFVNEEYGEEAVSKFINPIIGCCLILGGVFLIRKRHILPLFVEHNLRIFPFLRVFTWKYSSHPVFVAFSGVLIVCLGVLYCFSAFQQWFLP